MFCIHFSLSSLHCKYSIEHKMKFILIFLAFFSLINFIQEVLALRCVTSDGLQIEDVRKVIKKCMKKITLDYDSITNDDRSEGENEAKSYYQYENFDEDYEMRNKDLDTNEKKRDENVNGSRRNNDRMNNYSKNYNPSRLNHNYDYPQTGGNYYENNRRNDRHDSPQYNPYQFTYNDNNNFNNQRSSFYSSSNSQNKNNYNSTNDKGERDRACILQCFFQELKMV